MGQIYDTIGTMRICPFCNKEATSPHHIIPRAEGGEEGDRNIVYLCRACHDEYEGRPFSPDMIAQERLNKLGKKNTDKEEYHYRSAEGGILFMGIKIPGLTRLIGGPIFIPFNAQFIYLPVTKEERNNPLIQDTPNLPFMAVPQFPPKRKRGRPPITVSPDILLSTASLRELAAKVGVSPMTIKRRKDAGT